MHHEFKACVYVLCIRSNKKKNTFALPHKLTHQTIPKITKSRFRRISSLVYRLFNCYSDELDALHFRSGNFISGLKLIRSYTNKMMHFCTWYFGEEKRKRDGWCTIWYYMLSKSFKALTGHTMKRFLYMLQRTNKTTQDKGMAKDKVRTQKEVHWTYY